MTSDLTGDVTGDVSGNAGTVTNGVYTTGDQTIAGTKTFSSTISGSVDGNAATSTKLSTARVIAGNSFDGSADIDLPGVNSAGNQDTTGNAATASAAEAASALADQLSQLSADGATYGLSLIHI